MDVIYSDAVKKSAESYALLRQITERLEEVIGKTAEPVKAEWDRGEDGQGRPLYTLRLSDWTGKVSASFAPEELQPSTHLRFRLYQLWGDLLQIRSHKYLDALRGSGD